VSRKVFFSFHFKRDAWRAGQVRNCDLLADEDEYGVIDSVEWQKIERQGDAAIERWIEEQLKYTSVTVVLIGAETAERDWVDHEIRRSWERGNALLAVRVHKMKNQEGKTDAPGPNPLDAVYLKDGAPLSALSKTYDWVDDDGRSNLGQWVEEAFQARHAYAGEEELQEATARGALPTRSAASGPVVGTAAAGRTSAASGAFAPRAPWSASHDYRSR
jgi:MTH538 TIR-like domain (DUF1863)